MCNVNDANYRPAYLCGETHVIVISGGGDVFFFTWGALLSWTVVVFPKFRWYVRCVALADCDGGGGGGSVDQIGKKGWEGLNWWDQKRQAVNGRRRFIGKVKKQRICGSRSGPAEKKVNILLISHCSKNKICIASVGGWDWLLFDRVL